MTIIIKSGGIIYKKINKKNHLLLIGVAEELENEEIKINWQFPKGKLEPGLSMQQNAVTETHEETGLHAQITGHLGDYDGDTSTTRYYIGKRIGGNPADMGWESQSVKLVPMNDLHKYLNRSRDKQIATDLINKFKK